MLSTLQKNKLARRAAAAVGIFFTVVLGFCALAGFSAERDSVAKRPPMGWNSWDSYGTSVREEQVKANADVMARDLAKFGWQYIVVDIQWYEPNAGGHDYREGARLTMDEFGRLTPAENRFPSAANGVGFSKLADYVHGKGLKFGIHIVRGVPREAVEKNLPIWHSNAHAGDIADRKNICEWNPDMYGIDMSKAGAQEYYDSIAALYASWGVDFIKADDMKPALCAALAGSACAERSNAKNETRNGFKSLPRARAGAGRGGFAAIRADVENFRRLLGRLEIIEGAIRLHPRLGAVHRKRRHVAGRGYAAAGKIADDR